MKRIDLDPDDLHLITLAQEYSSNEQARALLESLRWPSGPVCPHCKNHKDKPIYTIKPGDKSKTRAGVYKCGACREQFTVTVGSIFEDSHIPLGKWLMAIFILCSSKKAISAHQLHRMLGVTYKTAWFLAHRIRFCMGPEVPLKKMLSGVVEVDETFVGGVGDPKTKILRKTPVVALVERGVYGAWHHVSRDHLPKYANEFAFRWNTRHDTDGLRMVKAVGLTEGKRLTYKQAV